MLVVARLRPPARSILAAVGLLAVALCALGADTAVAKPLHMAPYFDHTGSEVILVWDEASGKSTSWYFDKADKKFVPSAPNYQLPKKLGVKGKVRMAPYLGPKGSEVVLVYSPKSGKSVSWYFDEADKKYKRSAPEFQLPQKLLAKKARDLRLAPYLAPDKSEVILAWDKKSGKSASWYYDLADSKFKKSPAGYQLPQKLGLKGPVMMRPYLAKDGSEVVHVWSTQTGESINFYFDKAEDKYKRSGPDYQLPKNPGVRGEVFMEPYTDGQGTEVILVWSARSGKTVSWYRDNAENKFIQSAPEYQLPKKLGVRGKALMIQPYLDADASEVLLVYDEKSGASKGWYFDNADKKMKVAAPGFQMPAKLLR